MITLKITAKGQMTLKKEVMRHLGVKPGDTIDVERLPNGRIQMVAVPSREDVDIVLKPT
ncbi:AbrB/MazE/SpoVT family DNA-binding domain-containing protein [Rhizobium sp. LjRoot30]|uniref:AbrB/MazE/SpoVT family DNA-binding domain-containing protein n=1 Tax=Rhizobium sp. LjRoot30 TaxID=3342320 RepID=UPI003ECF7CD0